MCVLTISFNPVEKKALELIKKGKRNKEIANELSISISTLNKILYALRNKTGCSGKPELVAFTYEQKIFQTINQE